MLKLPLLRAETFLRKSSAVVSTTAVILHVLILRLDPCSNLSFCPSVLFISSWNEWARTPGSFGTVSDQLDVSRTALLVLDALCPPSLTIEEAEAFSPDCQYNMTLALAEQAALKWRLVYLVRREVRLARVSFLLSSCCSWRIWYFWTQHAEATRRMRV